jgi:flagellum-specific ATP synthase
MRVFGRIVEITGLIIKAVGLKASIGEACRVMSGKGSPIDAEVVGFRDGRVLLMADSDLSGIMPGSRIIPAGRRPSIRTGPALIGRIVDDRCNPLDDRGYIDAPECPMATVQANPLKRKRITEKLDLGIRAINGLLTCGKGQRVGIMAGSGVGKSMLLGMMARFTGGDVNVISLIGERAREVREFIERDLGEEGMRKSVVVVSTADTSPLAKVRAAGTATTIADYFMRQGKDVLLLLDSLTRVAMAQREIGLAVGEIPTSKGYTPSVFSLLPKLLERAGTSEGKGSITGLYTVLVEGDDMTDPIADSARAILDGHIVLSRELAMENHYPAIDLLNSTSRVMHDIIDPRHREFAGMFVETLANYRKMEDMINLGAYNKGSSEKVDYAISVIDNLKTYLRQGFNDSRDMADSLQGLYFLFADQARERAKGGLDGDEGAQEGL